MRIVVTENTTVDGVIDLSGGWFDPAGQEDKDLIAELRRQMDDEDGLLLGRVTFESFREYWPNQADDTTGIRDHLDRVPKYVLSGSLDEPGWQNSTVLRGPLADEVGKLRDAPGRDLGVTGSISVVQQLAASDLVDEYRLFVYPTVVGSGARLLPEETPRLDLRLVETRMFRNGVAFLRYERAHAR